MFRMSLVFLAGFACSIQGMAKSAFPNVCDVINAPGFRDALDLQVTDTVCADGIFSRPCAQISYYVPKYYIEVVSNPVETFFKALPGVAYQTAKILDRIPYGAEASSGSYSFHAHALNIPFSQYAFNPMSCGGTIPDLFCFMAMSEHLGHNWKTGAPDLWQPMFQLGALAPNACLAVGAAMSATGSSAPGYGGGSPLCSFRMDWIAKYPPSSQHVCTGWGIHFPRYGTVTSSDQTTASLVIASRIKSLGAEVFQSLASSPDEKWQMILPTASKSFREGQNVGVIWGFGVNDIGRLQGTTKNYLYAIWQKTSCKRDYPFVPFIRGWVNLLESVCKGA